MKRLILLACLAVLAIGQQLTPRDKGIIDAYAYSVDKAGSVRHFSGHVVIKTDAVTIRTEKADFNDDTNTITTHGEATVELK